jgi:hypothetical protein
MLNRRQLSQDATLIRAYLPDPQADPISIAFRTAQGAVGAALDHVLNDSQMICLGCT